MTDDVAGHTETTEPAAAPEAAAEPAAVAPEAAEPVAAESVAATGAAEASAKTGSWLSRNFSKPGLSAVKENFGKSGNGIKFARVAGSGVGLVLMGAGINEAISRDEEGNRHPVGGIIKTGVGALALGASLLAKGKGGPQVSA